MLMVIIRFLIFFIAAHKFSVKFSCFKMTNEGMAQCSLLHGFSIQAMWTDTCMYKRGLRSCAKLVKIVCGVFLNEWMNERMIE
jgi:hypothetical protein